MKLLLPKIKSISAYITIAILMFIFFPNQSFASTLFFSPQRANITIGSTQVVELRMDTDDDLVNAFTASISYPADIVSLSVTSLSSSFAIVAENSVNNGTVRITEGNIQPVEGNLLLATITIQGLASGVAKLTFDNSSAITKANDSTNTLSLSRSIGGYYTIVNPKSSKKQPHPLTFIDLSPVISQFTQSSSVPTPTISQQQPSWNIFNFFPLF